MGTWALPKNDKDLAALTKLLQAPLPANVAQDRLYHVLGDDMLFDAIQRAQKIDPASDVRSLVVRSIWHLYFTGEKTTTIKATGFDDETMSLISKPFPETDVFFKIAAVMSSEDAKDIAMVATDTPPEDEHRMHAFKEPNGLDYIVTKDDDRYFRIDGIWGVVNEIHPDNETHYKGDKQFSLSL